MSFFKISNGQSKKKGGGVEFHLGFFPKYLKRFLSDTDKPYQLHGKVLLLIIFMHIAHIS